MTISYGYWQGYTWKNELAVQSERVAPHFNEILSASSEAEHNPMHMLDRAIVLAGFSVRRMIEKKLVTDRLVEEKMLVRSFAANHSYHSEMGGHACRNYNLGKANTVHLGYMELANEIIHSSQIMVVHDEPKIGDGLLIASDWNLKKRLSHLTIEEFQSFVRRVLDDEIRAMSDNWDFETGQVHSKRE
jgi:hypothetical protein